MTANETIAELLKNLNEGFTTLDKMTKLLKLLEKRHIEQGKTISGIIELSSYEELAWRLETSVFGDQANLYTDNSKKYCIFSEFHNTLLFIKLTNEIIKIGIKNGDITDSRFYGQPKPGYNVPIKTVIHIFLRHNIVINSFLNEQSKLSKRSPTSFSFSALAEPMILLFMALNEITDRDWRKTEIGKNLICNFEIGTQCYSIISNQSKQIITFYPRRANLNTETIKFVRSIDKMKFLRINS